MRELGMMRFWYILVALAVVAGTLSPMATRVHADPAAADEGRQLGLFGTVVAIVGPTIILDGGEAVGTNDDTEFQVPGVDDASIADISLGDRLAIVAVELAGGGFLALIVLATPAEPVSITHVLGVVTETSNGVITLTDEDGNPFTVTLPAGVSAGIGDFLTIVSELDGDSDELSASDVASVRGVLQRLAEELEDALGEAEARLQALLGSNGDDYLTALVDVLGEVSEEVQEALEEAAEAAQEDLEAAFKHAGVEGPHVKGRGFVTASTSTSITIRTPDGDDLILKISNATKIKGPVEVGAFVEVKYSLEYVAAEVEVEDDELTFKGTVASATSTALTLEGGPTFTLTDATRVEGEPTIGTSVKVVAQPADGAFVAIRITVRAEGEDGKGGDDDYEGLEFEFEGTITAMSTSSSIAVDGLEVLLDAETKVEGTLAIGARVEVKATVERGAIAAHKVEVVDEDYEGGEEDDSDIEFKGKLTDFSAASIEVDGELTVLIDPDTRIRGALTLGVVVKVRAKAEGGALVAVSIKAKTSKRSKLEFTGIVATYVPFATLELEDGTGFLLNSGTRIRGDISQAAVVEIEAIRLGDGTLLATEIEAREDDDGESTGHSRSGGDDDDEDKSDSSHGGDDEDDEDKSGSSHGDDEDRSGSSD